MAVLSTSFLLLLLLISLTNIVESRPPANTDNGQVLEGLFGSHLSSLILAPPSPRDVSEGSANSPSPSSQANSRLVRRQEAARGLAGQQEVVLPQFFLDFLQRQRRFRGRSRKAAARGCFGMKMDRIGSISGLGC